MSNQPQPATTGPGQAPDNANAGEPVPQRRRTGGDIALGALLIVAGMVILGDVVLATIISVRLLGWMALIAGILLAAGAFSKMRSGGFWSAAFGGVVLIVLGLFILRNPLMGALTITLLTGALFLSTGLARIAGAGHFGSDRWLIVISGIISVGLGLFVLFNIVSASLTLVGVLLGIQTLIEGMTLLAAGRVRFVPASATPA
jgi:membrane protein HdeD